MSQHVTYLPPDDNLIKQFARAVCQNLSEQHSDASYSNPDIVNGLTLFLIFVAQLTAKHLNEGNHGLLDKNPEHR